MSRILATSFILLLLGSAVQAQNLPDFTDLVERYSPAVVHVRAVQQAQARQDPQAGQNPHEDMPEFFRRYFDLQPPGRQNRDRVSSGSGFVISSDGYILTNNHVIDGADQLLVRLSDRRELVATVVGTDPATDVALLKVEELNLPTVKLGDSEKLRPGEWVVAIGSPFDFDHTVTAGIVSAKGRSFGSDQQYVPFIQTDVPVNRGNSGGPLFNLQGEVVGINSQIYSNTGNYIGLSFAIPIEVATDVADQLKQSGSVSRGLLGVTLQQVTPALARTLGLPKVSGALINRVEPGSAAARAGLEVGDVILAFGDREIGLSSELPPLVGRTRPGVEIELTIHRDGKDRVVKATVGSVTPPPLAQSRTPAKSGKPSTDVLGMVVADLTDELRESLGEGVVIEQVVGEAARQAGLQPGDVVTMVDRQKIKDRAQYQRALGALKEGGSAALLIVRAGSPSFVVVDVQKGG